MHQPTGARITFPIAAGCDDGAARRLCTCGALLGMCAVIAANARALHQGPLPEEQ